MREFEPGITVVNMTKETAEEILKSYPNARKIGLMSTTGTRKTGVYLNQLQQLGLQVVQVPEEIQAELHDSIYNKEWGIKARTLVDPRAKSNFEKYSDYLPAQITSATEVFKAKVQQRIDSDAELDYFLR